MKPSSETPDAPSEPTSPTAYPEQAKEYLKYALEGSLQLTFGPGSSHNEKTYPGVSYSDGQFSPNGGILLCKENRGGAAEARWSSYATLNLTQNPTEIHSLDGEQWGFQDHILLDDNLIGFASSGVVGGQENSWQSIQLYNAAYVPLSLTLSFDFGEERVTTDGQDYRERELTGIGYDRKNQHYVLTYAKYEGELIETKDRLTKNRLGIAIYDVTGKLLKEMEVDASYHAPWSRNILILTTNNPVVLNDGRILLEAMTDDDVVTVLLVNPTDDSTTSLLGGDIVSASPDGMRAITSGYDQEDALGATLWNLSGKEPVPEILPAAWEAEGITFSFWDATLGPNQVYLLGESYSEDGEGFCGLFYWNDGELELLSLLPGLSYCSLVSGVDQEGYAHVLVHGLSGEDIEFQRERIEEILQR